MVRVPSTCAAVMRPAIGSVTVVVARDSVVGTSVGNISVITGVAVDEEAQAPSINNKNMWNRYLPRLIVLPVLARINCAELRPLVSSITY